MKTDVWWVLALALSCGDKPADPKPVEAKSAASEPTNDAPAWQPNQSVDRGTYDPKKDMCRAYDEDAVAKALGWQGLTKVSGMGGVIRGSRHRTCGYVGKGKIEDQHFGASFSMAKDFDLRHQGLQAVYEPRAAIAGHDARVARTETAVVLQLMTPQMRVTVDVAETGKTPAELEPLLEAAAIALVGSLPDDALDLLAPDREAEAKAAAARAEAKAAAKAAREAKAARAGKAPAKGP
jgi:hypothetical protein